jgi:carbohydrate-selective porin OprB
MSVDPFDGRTEMSAADFVAWRSSQGQTGIVIPPAEETAPDWQTSEKAFQQKVDDFAREHGWALRYHTWRSANSSPGFCDWVAIRGARLEIAELKVADNKPTKAQLHWLDAFRAVSEAARAFGFEGIGVRLWVPEMWSEIEEVLR